MTSDPKVADVKNPGIQPSGRVDEIIPNDKTIRKILFEHFTPWNLDENWEEKSIFLPSCRL